MAQTHTLAFEIGVEEIPAFDLHAAADQLQGMVPAAFDAARIPYGSFAVRTSPRRIIVMAYDVADATEALMEEHRGPAAKIAFDEAGKPTKAAIGFARGKGLAPEDLERREVGGVEYVFATKSVPAVPVIDLLPTVLTGFIEDLKWPRSQRWAAYREYFVRPVRWILALLDDAVIPLRFANLTSGNVSWGHRVLAPGPHEVATAADLLDVVRSEYVVPSEAEREEIIRAGVARIEEETGLAAELPAKTLLEVVNLSEYPQPLLGSFDEEFLRVPEEIIVDAMLMHQRYFPLYDADHALTNKFVIVSNGDPRCAATIVDGNERVVRARLDDAKFFYEEDLKQPLEAYVEKLDQVVFQESLGTVRAKALRLQRLARFLGREAGLPAADAADLERAAYLCKADLVTNAVIEFTSVQGVMGSYYAAAAGETPQVARAIGQHYQPRFAGDAAPDSTVGKLVAFADKLDTICGLFAVRQGPTGSSDPFGLRRGAIGIVGMLDAGLPVSLGSSVDESLAAFADQGIVFDAAAARAAVIDFFATRTKVILRDRGAAADAVDSVLATGVAEPAIVCSRVRALEAARTQSPEVMGNLAIAYARANNLRDASLGTEVDPALFGGVESSLDDAVAAAAEAVPQALSAHDYPAALRQLAALRGPIDAFFDEVRVMDDDVALRANRLRLLNKFVAVFTGVADFGKLAKRA
ncbi:glycine--tRNA ligase subunit beta [Curtanaerobium respiraculi]|uniref:glycine--tRNA ligase subunit beta n=1 Tax=Curtanaerobium respiraculi TaxID=2949669 RepID=UPI0024B3BA41|nr:glycine--tRNA ligase subunit beta [Curtanaerobium respiraculi]